MKAMVVSPVGGRVPSTRGVLQHSLGINGTRRDLEAEEVAAYLTKLRSLVPDMPRKKKLSKLEVIQRVIEYICDLQSTLEETNTHNDGSSGVTGMRINNAGGQAGNNNNNNNSTNSVSSNTRQPLQPLFDASTTLPSPVSGTAVTSATIAER